VIYAFSVEICFSAQFAQRKALKTPQVNATMRKAPQPPWVIRKWQRKANKNL